MFLWHNQERSQFTVLPCTGCSIRICWSAFNAFWTKSGYIHICIITMTCSVCLCVCVCAYMCVWERVRGCVYVAKCVYIYVIVYVHMLYTYVCMCVHMHAYIILHQPWLVKQILWLFLVYGTVVIVLNWYIEMWPHKCCEYLLEKIQTEYNQ